MNNQNKKKLIYLIILSTFLFIILPFVSAQNVLDNLLNSLLEPIKNTLKEGFGETPGEIIVSLVVALILFAALYDLLTLIPIFYTEWVKYIIAGGVAVIGIVFKWPITIAEYGLGIGATLGVVGIALVVIVLALILIGLALGKGWAVKWTLRRRAMMHEIRAAEGAEAAGTAIEALGRLEGRLEAAGKAASKKRP